MTAVRVFRYWHHDTARGEHVLSRPGLYVTMATIEENSWVLETLESLEIDDTAIHDGFFEQV